MGVKSPKERWDMWYGFFGLVDDVEVGVEVEVGVGVGVEVDVSWPRTTRRAAKRWPCRRP